MKKLIMLLPLAMLVTLGSLWGMEKVITRIRMGNPDSEPKRLVKRSPLKTAAKQGYAELCMRIREQQQNKR